MSMNERKGRVYLAMPVTWLGHMGRREGGEDVLFCRHGSYRDAMVLLVMPGHTLPEEAGEDRNCSYRDAMVSGLSCQATPGIWEAGEDGTAESTIGAIICPGLYCTVGNVTRRQHTSLRPVGCNLYIPLSPTTV